ncbi:unnamed protein product (mitochondrion) [Plasmodiophora brassicae]|uniref:Mitochondrial carrier protein n=1 Tax=Plasmodiophora brassicae TaxID=37360 RepID=A0A3P3YI53_PLABS|nr:unnamed protein product [Plasmodiophora brassicae]
MAAAGDGRARIVDSLVAGGMAGAVAKTVIAPLDRVKILYQVTPSSPFTLPGAFASLCRIVGTEGVLGLWRGHTATLLRIVPYAAIQYTSFEQFKRVWLSIQGGGDANGDIAGFAKLCSGSLAGFTSVVVTYPLDLLRARLAVERDTSQPRFGSLYRITRSILASRGVAGLYTGLTPTLMGIVPYAGISFWTFETLKSLLLSHSDRAKLSHTERMACGGCAGLLAQSASYPLEVIRRRMQVDATFARPDGSSKAAPSSTAGIVSLARRIYETEGFIGGLYKGLSLNWIKGPIAVGISFTCYDAVQAHLQERYTTTAR